MVTQVYGGYPMTAIIAVNHAEAAEVAESLKIPGDGWLYPRNVHLLRGRTFGRIIYVEGWERSTIPAEILEALVPRMQPGYDELRVSPGDAEQVQQDARRELERLEYLARLTSPFVDTSQIVSAPQYHRGIKRSLWRRIWGAVKQFAHDTGEAAFGWLRS